MASEFNYEPLHEVVEAQKRVIDAMMLLARACLDKINASAYAKRLECRFSVRDWLLNSRSSK